MLCGLRPTKRRNGFVRCMSNRFREIERLCHGRCRRDSSRSGSDNVMKQDAINRYLDQQITNMHSLDMVIGMFDYCLSAALTEDVSKVTRGLDALEESLSFHECPELARLFQRVYEHCRRLAWEGRFEETHNCLRLLRDAWSEAKQRRKPARGKLSGR